MKQIEFSNVGTPQDVVRYADAEWTNSHSER